MVDEGLHEAALQYHRSPRPGKLQVVATKALATQRDLALAYSPGVAAACEEIVANPLTAAEYTSRGNLVGVVTNGTAVLGLGSIGPLASKPVMEGKAVLFKKFADIDSFDIEVNSTDIDHFVEVVAALEPTFGAINLEDIKAPECFEIERRLKERMGIPVFHDDQHGTAICVAAAIRNGLELQGKELSEAKIVACGGGAASLACLALLVNMGAQRHNIVVTDRIGVVYRGRHEEMDVYKAHYAIETEARTLEEVIPGSDVFLGLSAPGVLKPEWLAKMADKPVILALANPTPEIMPDLAREARPDAIIATGRSDFPNQVNNVLCFPFLFRGALDVGATEINEAMKIAAVEAIASLVRATTPETVVNAYGLELLAFGPEYIIPKPFDPRLMLEVPVAVAQAAMATGVATRPLEDVAAYRHKLSGYVIRSGFLMKPVVERARAGNARVIFSDGEEERVLRAVDVLLEERICQPILIGRPDVIERRMLRLGLRFRLGEDALVVDPGDDPRYDDYVDFYHKRMCRKGITPAAAREVVRTRSTVIASIAVAVGDADALIAGPIGRFDSHLEHIEDILGRREDMHKASTVHALVLDTGPIFIADTFVTEDPTAEDLAETTLAAAEVLRQLGTVPKVAFVSHSNFGTHHGENVFKLQEALRMVRAADPSLEVDGEMHADSALSERIRDRVFPNSPLRGQANLLIMPNLDAANIGFNLVRAVTGVVAVGPILIGPAKPAHIAAPSITSRGVINLTAIAAAQAAGWD